MVIGIDASRANRPHKTGTEWYSYYLIRWLAKLDSKNEYWLFTDKPMTGGLLDLTTAQHEGPEYEIRNEKIIVDKDGFQAIKSPFGNFRAKILDWPFYFFWTQGRLSWEMLKNKLGGKVDILFVPAHTLPLVHPRKSLVTIHDVGFERERILYRSQPMGPESAHGRRLIDIFVRLFTLNKYGANNLDYLSWSTRYGLKHAHRIICVSEFTKRDIMDLYGTPAGKIKVIHNGYNRHLYRRIKDQASINDALDRYDIKSPYLLYVGRLERKKNTPSLIEAFARMRENDRRIKHKLVLIGDAGYGYDEVNYAIREFNMDREVIMPGWVEEDDMPFIFNGAAAFVFPSRYEGFGIPLLQAMACGVPIAASWSSSIPEVVKKAALLFNPYDIASMSEALSRIINDAELRRDLVGQGDKRINDFSWERTAEETIDFINSLAG
jgi:glycosyltransferase involved in cell wall biosynthesis